MNLKIKLDGFHYLSGTIATDSVPDKARAVFRAKKILQGIVYDTVALEDNPFTFPEVKTLLDGVTVGGHKLSDEKQVLNQAKSWNQLLSLVAKGQFQLSKERFLELHALVAEDEALTWGQFRDGAVAIAGTAHQPPQASSLADVFDAGKVDIHRIANVHEQAVAFFLFGSLNQFFWDGNKRTSRLMMNGLLLAHGYDVINIPAAKKLEFNQKMIRFYDSLDGSEMMQFMVSCSLDSTLRIVRETAIGAGPV